MGVASTAASTVPVVFPSHLTAIVSIFGLLFLIGRWFQNRLVIPAGSKLAPGPVGRPLIGNVAELPPYWVWLKWKSWADQYGPIIKFSIFGTLHYVVSTEKVANDLFGDRGAIYSSREPLPAGAILLNERKPALFQPVDPSDPLTQTWKKHRKFYHKMMAPPSLKSHSTSHNLESLRLIKNLLQTPKEYDALFHRFAAGIVFRLVYGKPVVTGQEPFVTLAIRRAKLIAEASRPGAYLIDSFRWLMYLPDFLVPSKAFLKKEYKETHEALLGAQSEMKELIKQGNAPNSFMRALIEGNDSFGFTEEEGAFSTGSLFSAGYDTTAGAMSVCLLALVLHPEWITKMQEEIDEVVGSQRVPSFDDIEALPTVRAVIKESLRWRPLQAGGIPHKTIKDDVYDGIFVPAGTNVHPAQWAIHREEALYPDPDNFHPERWLSPDWPTTYKEPLTKFPNLQGFSAFGFGRRICPGLNLAERSLNTVVSRMAWACNIGRELDSAGNPIPIPEYDMTMKSIIARPKPFACSLTPRSDERMKVLETALQEAIMEDPLQACVDEMQ